MKNRWFFFTLVCSIYIYISVLVDLERHFAFHPAVFDTKKAQAFVLGFFFFFRANLAGKPHLLVPFQFCSYTSYFLSIYFDLFVFI